MAEGIVKTLPAISPVIMSWGPRADRWRGPSGSRIGYGVYWLVKRRRKVN